MIDYGVKIGKLSIKLRIVDTTNLIWVRSCIKALPLLHLINFRNKFGMIGSIIGFFSCYPVCLRIAGITPSPKGCATNATTNLHFVKKGISRYDRNVGFPTRSFCTLQGGVAG